MARAAKYRYEATVKRVIDGDTAEVEVDLGLTVFCNIIVRFAGINCPEKNTPEGKVAKEYVTKLLTGKLIEVQTIKKDSFGRWLATLWDGPLHINKHLIDAGHAKEYRS
jgi:micrococcal nuclease